MRQSVAFAVVLVVVVSALGSLEYYTYDTLNNKISVTKASLSSEIADLQNIINTQQNSITSMQNTLTSLQNTVNPLPSDITSLQNTLASLQNTLTSLQSTVTQNQQAESTSVQQISSQLQNISVTLNALSTKVASLTPQVPLSTLVVVSDTYDNATRTFTFQVQNTQDYIVYAQFDASMYGSPCCGFPNQAGGYASQVFQFPALSIHTVNFDVASATYDGQCIGTVSSTELYFVAAAQSGTGTQVSGVYTLTISPGYPNPYRVCN